MIKLKLFVLFLPFCLSLMGQNTAEEIFEKAADQLLTQNLELSLEIKEIASNGQSKDKQYDVLIAKFGGTKKTKTIVQQPAKLKGITIVITNYSDAPGLIEIFTPANGKIRKMKATSKNMDLVNSGVSISNYTSEDRDQLTFAFEGKEEFEGKSCYKLKVNDVSNFENGETEYLIEENTYRILKIITFDEEGKEESSTTYSDFKEIEQFKGKIQPMFMVNKDLKKAKYNEIKVLKVSSRPDLKEENFIIETAIN